MHPYFHCAADIERFVKIVDGRAKVFPLLESKDSFENIDEILNVPGIDEIHIGLNDLSLDLKKKFMFELLTDGTVEQLCKKFRKKGIPYVDYNTKMRKEDGSMKDSLSGDGVHPTEEGYLIMEQQVKSVIDKVLKKK